MSRFGLNKRCLTTSFNSTTFTKGLLVFIIYNFFDFQIFYNNRVLLNKSKKHVNFHIFSIFCLLKFKLCLNFMNLLWHVNVMQCICCLRKSCNLYYKKLNLKMLTFLVWFEIVIYFRQNTSFGWICTIFKFILIQIWFF
jgi:hypothetical protein